jgi:hypothetical protein
MPLTTRKLLAASNKINHPNLYFIQKLTATITVDEALTIHPQRLKFIPREYIIHSTPVIIICTTTPPLSIPPNSAVIYTNAWQHDVFK